MQAIEFDFGENIDRSRFCRWHFCRYDKWFLIKTIGEDVTIYLN